MSDECSLDCDTNSWHYKTIEKTWKNYHYTPVPRNFCPYMRKLVLSIFALPFVLLWRQMPQAIQNYEEIFLTLFIYGILVHTVYGLMFVLSGGIYYERIMEDGKIIDEIAREFQWWWGTAFYFASIAVVSAVIGAVILVCNWLDERKRKRREQGTLNSNQSINLFKSYIHSKHNKICPHMNFYNGEEKKND